MKAIRAFVEGMRPKQWTKNLIIFLGVIFAQQTGDHDLLLRSLTAFLLFCLFSGAIYHFNDRMDLDQDRRHPRKSKRPLASGRLPLSGLYFGLFIIVVGALTGAWFLGRNFFLLGLVFLALNVLYSLWLKHLVLLDVFGIAINFVLRAVAGVAVLAPVLVTDFGGANMAGVAGSVLLSPWLLICTFFGSLFLAFGKRRNELLSLDDPSAHRRVLAEYTPALLDHLVTLTAGTVMVAYALYTLWPSTVARYGMGFLATNVFVAYGVMRYLFLVYRLDCGGDPSEILLRDRPILITVFLWFLFIVWKVVLH
ncbi:MAG: UbiA prenyltransferase family protein [bacterium]|nr:UbiA prenyltransferase family protein [bacterium]